MTQNVQPLMYAKGTVGEMIQCHAIIFWRDRYDRHLAARNLLHNLSRTLMVFDEQCIRASPSFLTDLLLYSKHDMHTVVPVNTGSPALTARRSSIHPCRMGHDERERRWFVLEREGGFY